MDARALIAFVALVSLDAAAGGIYKCVEAGATTYQSTPCGRGQDETPLRIASNSPQATRDQPVSVPVAATQAKKRGPWTRTTVEVGISDDEVLNMPGWGRPAQISRSRVGREWEEVWRYGSGYSGQRELRFVNARLTEIVEAPPALASAR
jgi:Domain of unknown function (DUF4124)